MSPAKPKPDALNDRDLALRASGGCLHAFEELVRRYEGRLFNFVLRRVCEPADAEDIVQQAFLKAWQAIDRYDPRWQFSTWLHTIAIRVAASAAQRDLCRRNTTRGAAQQPQQSPADPAASCARREASQNIWALVDRVLDEEPRLALWLHYAEDMAPREIARVLGRTSGAVRVMLHRARRRLAEHCSDEPSENQRRRADVAVAVAVAIVPQPDRAACTKGGNT